jgi:ArsR family transcriptional regulator
LLISVAYDLSVATSRQSLERSLDADLLRVLADPRRAQIVTLLAAEQLCTCHLVELTGASQSNVSNHLRLLREAGVVQAEAAGRFTYYRLVPERLGDLSAALAGLAVLAGEGATRKRPCS